MSSPTLQVSVNAGTAQTGGLEIVDGDVVQLSLADTVGVTTCLWEVYDFPAGASTPSGWTLDSVSGRWYVTTTSPHTPPSIDFQGYPWGKYLFRATTSDGSDEATAVQIKKNEWEDIGSKETTQFDPIKGFIGALQRNLRLWESLLYKTRGHRTTMPGTSYGDLKLYLNGVYDFLQLTPIVDDDQCNTIGISVIVEDNDGANCFTDEFKFHLRRADGYIRVTDGQSDWTGNVDEGTSAELIVTGPDSGLQYTLNVSDATSYLHFYLEDDAQARYATATTWWRTQQVAPSEDT
jgi:hypothetical protein